MGPLSLSLYKGDFAAVIGPNGSGKSTLFRSIVCDLAWQEGEVLLAQSSVRALSSKARARQIAVVSPESMSYPMTVEEYVMMGRIPYQKGFGFSYSRQDKSVVEACMEREGVSPIRHKYMKE